MNSSYSDGVFYASNIKFNPFVAYASKSLHKGVAIDFGCGAGTNLYNLMQEGWIVYGVDREPLAIQKAQSKLPRDHIFLSEIDSFDFEKVPKAELILCNYVFQHLSRHEIERFVTNISSKVKTGGHFVFSFFEHRTDVTFSQVSNLLEEHRWKLLKMKEWSRLDTDHGDPHMHYGVESLWYKL